MKTGTRIRSNVFAKQRARFSRGGRMAGLGKNTRAKLVGPKGRRVSIPRAADSFKSKTDNT